MPTSFDGVELLQIKDLSHETTEAHVVHYRYNSQLFAVLISTTPPEGCEREGAIERSWIDRLWDLSRHIGVDHDDARLWEQIKGEVEIAKQIRDVVFPTLERLAPSPTPAACELGPACNTVAEYLFPHRIRLELVTRNGELEVLLGHHEELDRTRLVVSWNAMCEIGFEPGSVPTFAAKDVSLGSRVVMGPPLMEVFDVSVPGMDQNVVGKIICTMDDLQEDIKREMEIYGKLKKLSLDPEIRVPEFKGENSQPYSHRTLRIS